MHFGRFGFLMAISMGLFASTMGQAFSRKAPPEKLYDGKTLEEWREAFKNLSPDNPASQNAVPGLIAITKDRAVPWFTRRQAANTLGRLGKNAPAGVPVLLEILEEPSAGPVSSRIWAMKAISLYGPVAKAATPKLIEILKDENNPLAERQVTLEALSQVAGAHPRAIPAVVEVLSIPMLPGASADSETESLRELAVESVAQIGTDASIAAPVLLRFLNAPRESLRRSTVTALGRIGPPASLAIPALLESLAFDDSPAVRDEAETALANLGLPTIPAMEHLLDDPEAELRERAARTLGKIGPNAQAAVTALKKRLDDESSAVRYAAAVALWKISKQAQTSIPVLVETLKSPDRDLRMKAFRTITEELGTQAVAAKPALKKLLDHPDSSTRQTARKALEKIEVLSPSVKKPAGSKR